MFKNNINGNNNKVKIKQKNISFDKKNYILEIAIGIIITVVGGLILYMLIGG